jgi:hypothetical protein
MGYERKFEGRRLALTRGMSRAEIAKLVRQDIKHATMRGDLPQGLKVSVRTREYAGGGSIDVRVTSVPASFNVLFLPRVYAEFNTPHVYNNERPYRSVQAEALVHKLEAILQAYNFDDSDSQSDYFHVRFYGHADIDGDVTSKERIALRAAFDAGQMADPGELSYLDFREQVEQASKLSADPVNEQAVQAVAAARALGAAPKKSRVTPQVPALLYKDNEGSAEPLVSEYESQLRAAGFI